jgi:dienelactone hydrolase
MMRRLVGLVSIAVAFAGAPAAAHAQASTGDQWLRRPVDARTFATFLDFFTYDRALRFETVRGDSADLGGVRRVHITFVSTPGMRVPALLYEPSGGPSPRPAVILIHGGSARGKETAAAVQLSQLMSRAGFTVLAIDMPHFGERQDGLFTLFTNPEKAERLYNQPPVYLAFVTQLVKDVGRSYDWLTAEGQADPRRVALVGFSRGAQEAFIAGGADRRIAAVAGLYGGHFDAMETGHLAAACPANYIGHISPRPLLMINGTQDQDFFRAVSVEPLFRLARQPRRIEWAETGHQLPTPEHQAMLVEWLREQLR